MEESNQDVSRYAFPHLDDTAFPLLDNVDVYEYENDFDYKRWTDSTKICLCNVLWNSDYSNVVKFHSDEERDKWFDNLGGYKVELTSAFNVAPNGTVKVPIPYQVATRYNYLYVDLPIMTSEEEPINYEDMRRTKRYYYFITDVSQNAPSNTTLLITPDNWTTYINNIEIPYMMLERGHAPMSVTSVDDYLENPIGNNRYLLAPDVDFSSGNGIVKSADFVPVNNGVKYIMFATTMSRSQVKGVSYPASVSGNSTPATFANADTRNGYQYIVNNYEWKYGAYDYANCEVDSTSFQSSNGAIPNNMTMVACKASSAQSMFAYMSEHIPFFFKTIKACFMVDDSMFSLGEKFTFCNTDCFMVEPAEDSVLSYITLSREDFNYSDKYANIAKLYTSPYALIEVTDNDGNSKQFKIENTSNLAIRKAASLAFPFISIQTFITGINGNSAPSTYKWEQINGTSKSRQMFSDDFGEFLWEWSVPTYAMYVSGYDDFKATNYPSLYIDRYNAIAEYHKSTGMANTQYENAKASANTTQQMTNNSADTENTNARAMASTINTNNIASANTEKTNSNASSDTAETNVNNQSAAQVQNTDDSTITSNAICKDGITAKNTQVFLGNELNKANQAWDAGLTRLLAQIENSQTAVTGFANMVGSIGDTASSGLSSLGSLNVLGAIGAQVQGGINLATAGVSSVVAICANQEIAEKTIDNSKAKLLEVNNNNGDLNEVAVNLQDAINGMQNILSKKITKTTTNMWNTNADNTNTTNHANAARQNATSVANANRTLATSNSNADRTEANSKTNAKLNRDTSVANSGYTRENTVDNAKITLEQRRIEAQQKYKTSALASPVQYGANSGDPKLDAFERKGLQVKVRTQSDGEIAQAGDLMLRFGYALNQVWNVAESGLCLMRHYTYWKAADLWVNEGEGVNQGAQSDIQRAFENGVTVWSNPNEIGKVSIYDNWN